MKILWTVQTFTSLTWNLCKRDFPIATPWPECFGIVDVTGCKHPLRHGWAGLSFQISRSSLILSPSKKGSWVLCTLHDFFLSWSVDKTYPNWGIPINPSSDQNGPGVKRLHTMLGGCWNEKLPNAKLISMPSKTKMTYATYMDFSENGVDINCWGIPIFSQTMPNPRYLAEKKHVECWLD